MEDEYYELMPDALNVSVTGNRKEAIGKAKLLGQQAYDTGWKPQNIQVNWTNRKGKTVDLTKKAVNSYNDWKNTAYQRTSDSDLISRIKAGDSLAMTDYQHKYGRKAANKLAATLGGTAAVLLGAEAIPLFTGVTSVPETITAIASAVNNGKLVKTIGDVIRPMARFYFSTPIQGTIALGDAARMGYNWKVNGKQPTNFQLAMLGASALSLGTPYVMRNGFNFIKNVSELGQELYDTSYAVARPFAKGVNYGFKKFKDWFPSLYNKINVPSYRAIKMMNEKVPIGLRKDMKDFIIDYNLSKSHSAGLDVGPSLLEFPSNNAIDSYVNYIKKAKIRPDSRLDALQNQISHHFGVPHYTLRLGPGGYNAYTGTVSNPNSSSSRIVLANDWLRNLKPGDTEEARRLLAHELQHVSDNALKTTNPTIFNHLYDYDTSRGIILGKIARTEPNLSPWYYSPEEFRAVAASHTAISPIGKPLNFKSLPTIDQRVALIRNVADKFYIDLNADGSLNKFYNMAWDYPGLKQGGKLIKWMS